MFRLPWLWIGVLTRMFRSHDSLLIENLGLRQQLAVLKRRRNRPSITLIDKVFWASLRRFWSSWKSALIMVKPQTVVRWHRSGFQFYWRLVSRAHKPLGRRPITQQIRDLIFKMMAQKSHLGVLHEFTANSRCSAWRSRKAVYRAGCAAPRGPQTPPSAGWLSFEITAKLLPPWTSSQYRPSPFGVLYGFIGHDRRRILHFNVTRHPTSAWIVQQLREAFPSQPMAEFLILDHDSKYGAEVFPSKYDAEVFPSLRSMDLKPVRTSIGCPWQNGIDTTLKTYGDRVDAQGMRLSGKPLKLL